MRLNDIDFSKIKFVHNFYNNETRLSVIFPGFTANTSYRTEYKLQNPQQTEDIIQKSRVELKFLNLLYSGDLNTYFDVQDISPNSPYYLEGKNQTPVYTEKILNQKMRISLIEYMDSGYPSILVCDKNTGYKPIDMDQYTPFTKELLKLSAMDNNELYSCKFKIEGTWSSDQVDSTGKIPRVFIPSKDNNICVNNEDGVYQYSYRLLTFEPTHYQICFSVILPVSYYRIQNYQHPFELHTPPEKFYFLGIERVKSATHLPIIITECYDWYDQNKTHPDVITLGLIGDSTVYDKYDFSALSGRELYYTVGNFNIRHTYSNEEAMKNALKFASVMKSKNIKVKFLISNVPSAFWECPAIDFKGGIFTTEELVDLAHRLSYKIPENIDTPICPVHSALELSSVAPSKIVMKPFMTEGSMTLIYGATNVGKTYFSMLLGLSLASGKPILNDNWMPVNHQGVKTLTIYGEMTRQQIGDRINDLAEFSNIPKQSLENYCFHEKDEIDLGDDDVIKKLDRIIKNTDSISNNKPLKVLIFDNLSTLCSFPDNPVSFKKMISVFKHYAQRGYTIIIIHHENAKGLISGGVMLKNCVDYEFHLTKNKSDNDKINIGVTSDKNRNCKPSDMLPFDVTIDFKNSRIISRKHPPHERVDSTVEHQSKEDVKDIIDAEEFLAPGESANGVLDTTPHLPEIKSPLPVRELRWKSLQTPEEKVVAIEELVKAGYKNKDIAAKLEIAVSTLMAFRKKMKIRKKDNKTSLQKTT